MTFQAGYTTTRLNAPETRIKADKGGSTRPMGLENFSSNSTGIPPTGPRPLKGRPKEIVRANALPHLVLLLKEKGKHFADSLKICASGFPVAGAIGGFRRDAGDGRRRPRRRA